MSWQMNESGSIEWNGLMKYMPECVRPAKDVRDAAGPGQWRFRERETGPTIGYKRLEAERDELKAERDGLRAELAHTAQLIDEAVEMRRENRRLLIDGENAVVAVEQLRSEKAALRKEMLRVSSHASDLAGYMGSRRCDAALSTPLYLEMEDIEGRDAKRIAEGGWTQGGPLEEAVAHGDDMSGDDVAMDMTAAELRQWRAS